MKAIIIENELMLDEHISKFLEENPNLFTEIQEELYCLHRNQYDLVEEILKNDAIIVASTWMYKDQLEEYLEGFQYIPAKKIFAHDILNTLNEWNGNGDLYFKELELIKLILKLIENGFEIFSFYKDYDVKPFIYTYKQIKYNKEQNIFEYEISI